MFFATAWWVLCLGKSAGRRGGQVPGLAKGYGWVGFWLGEFVDGGGVVERAGAVQP